MKLNHLDLQIPDVPALARFLVDHFGLEAKTRLDSPKLAILTDGAGFTLVLQHRVGEPYPEGFHIGFHVDDPAEVHARRDRIAAAGVAISEVAVSARGASCYCQAPGVLIELGCLAGTRVDPARQSS